MLGYDDESTAIIARYSALLRKLASDSSTFLPSFEFLAKYFHDRSIPIQDSARLLFHSSLDCLSQDQRVELVSTWIVYREWWLFNFSSSNFARPQAYKTAITSNYHTWNDWDIST